MCRLNKALFGTIVLFALSCGVSDGGDDSNNNASASGIDVDITADKSPALMETVTLSCSYEVVSPTLPVGRDDFIAEGHFTFPSTHFEVVSGESSWVDTVKVNEKRDHQVVVRALIRGDWLVDALVSSVIREGKKTIGGGDSVELHVQ